MLGYMALSPRTKLPSLLAALAAFALILWPSVFLAGQGHVPAALDVLPLAQVQPGMTGYAETIFAGDEIERFELEVLGVLPNLLGPKEHIILVRLKGPKVEHTGVVGGMSGSPVYLQGKLAGALSLRFGAFAKEPLAGVTPIESLLEASEPRTARAELRSAGTAGLSGERRYALPPEFVQARGLEAGAFLTPIETPLVFSGFHPLAIGRFAEQLAAEGLVAAHGGTAEARPDDANLRPGDMVSMVLVQGDLSVAASCTVSAVTGDRVFLCGHPVFGYGSVEMPLARARVVTTLASSMSSVKIVTAGGVIGRVTDDRLTAVLGRLGPPPRMIPMELTTATARGEKQFRFELVEHPKLTPLLVGLSTLNGLVSNTAYSEGMTFQLTGEIELEGYPAVNLENMFAPTDMAVPDGLFVASTVQSVFTRVFTNPYEPTQIRKVRLRVEATPERRWAAIEGAWCDKSEVSAGEDAVVKVLLRPYRGAPFIREVPIRIPPQVPRGALRILVSDSDTLNRMTRFFTFSPQSRLAGLEQLITLLNRERRNNRLYVTLLQPSPTLLLEDKELPNAPGSQINVLDQRRSMGSSVLLRESTAGEWSVRMNQVIAGQYVLNITVR